jgi:hypothetical protein
VSEPRSGAGTRGFTRTENPASRYHLAQTWPGNRLGSALDHLARRPAREIR